MSTTTLIIKLSDRYFEATLEPAMSEATFDAYCDVVKWWREGQPERRAIIERLKALEPTALRAIIKAQDILANLLQAQHDAGEMKARRLSSYVYTILRRKESSPGALFR